MPIQKEIKNQDYVYSVKLTVLFENTETFWSIPHSLPLGKNVKSILTKFAIAPLNP
jgi:hypothetical protein